MGLGLVVFGPEARQAGADTRPPLAAGGHGLGQLIAAPLVPQLVLGGVGLAPLAHQPVHLGLQPGTGAVGAQGGVGPHLGPVQGHHAHPHHADPPTQGQHLDEQVLQRLLVVHHEPGDRPVVGLVVAGDHPVGDVHLAQPGHVARRHHSLAVAVDDEGQHHVGVIGGAAGTVVGMASVQGARVQLGHDLEHEPRQVLGGQPLPHARRQQEKLIAITHHVRPGHARIVPVSGGRAVDFATASYGHFLTSKRCTLFSSDWRA